MTTLAEASGIEKKRNMSDESPEGLCVTVRLLLPKHPGERYHERGAREHRSREFVPKTLTSGRDEGI